MKTKIDLIESGRQLGHSLRKEFQNKIYWYDAGIQKFNDRYCVHVSQIDEEKVIAESYEIYFTREFETLKEAIDCLERQSVIKFNELHIMTGQKIFNPSILEEKN